MAGPWMGWLWILVIVGAVLLLRWIPGVRRRRRDETPDRALAVLRERYARGEIDQAEFDERLRDLTESSSH